VENRPIGYLFFDLPSIHHSHQTGRKAYWYLQLAASLGQQRMEIAAKVRFPLGIAGALC